MLLREFVNKKMASADKEASAEGYPLELSNCKKYKPMRDLKIYGNSFQDGTPSPDTPIEVQSVGKLVTDTTDVNYGKYKIPVVQRGINLFCLAKTDAKEQTINGITFTPLGDERVHIKGKAIDETKAFSFYYRTTETGNMPIKRGTYRAKPTQWVWAGLTLMFGCNNGSKGQNINSMSSSVSLDMDNGYIGSLYIGLGGDALKREWDDIIELQLMGGNQNLPYEPYVEPVTTNIFLDEPLRKLGNYADYIDFRENKVVRNVREIVYKGGEITKCYKGYVSKGFYLWQTSLNMYNDADLSYFSSWTTNFPEKSTHLIACTSLSSDNIKPNNWYINRDFGIHFALAPETYASDGVEATIEDMNNWLTSQYENGTPVKFNYILKEPTEEPLTLDLPKLNAKTSIIEVDTSLAPSSAYGKYIKK